MFRRERLLILMLASCGMANAGEPQQLILARFQGSADAGMSYLQQMLRAALQHTRDYADLPVTLSQQAMSPQRMFSEITKADGFSNIAVWACDGRFMRGNGVRRLAVPVDRGMLSYWLILTRSDRLATFQQIDTLQQLQGLTFSFGYPLGNNARLGWLQNLDIRDAPDMKQAMLMLQYGRFDGILVSATHAQLLRSQLPADGKLAFEPRLLLVYPAATCFAMGNQRAQLATQLQQGLQTIIANGQADAISHANHQTDFDPQLGLAQRKQLRINADANTAKLFASYRQWLYQP